MLRKMQEKPRASPCASIKLCQFVFFTNMLKEGKKKFGSDRKDIRFSLKEFLMALSGPLEQQCNQLWYWIKICKTISQYAGNLVLRLFMVDLCLMLIFTLGSFCEDLHNVLFFFFYMSGIWLNELFLHPLPTSILLLLWFLVLGSHTSAEGSFQDDSGSGKILILSSPACPQV